LLLPLLMSLLLPLQLSFILDQLEQVQEGHPFDGRPVVILAEKSKEEMDDLVRRSDWEFMHYKGDVKSRPVFCVHVCCWNARKQAIT
jgi:hypothetical protein